MLARKLDDFIERHYANNKSALLRISAHTRKRTSLPNTMVFFDEVQKCPEIITWIKFLVDNGIPAKLRHIRVIKRKSLGVSNLRGFLMGAEDEVRTRDPQLGRLMLYRLSYFRSLAPFSKRCKDITFCDMPYRLLIIFSASSAEIGENRLKFFPSLSITSSNMDLGLTHTPCSPYMA